jgi:DNA-binding transcriptional regulator YiaG
MHKELEYPQPSQQRSRHPVWNAQRIRALREYLQLTQNQMADELQVRQQTISEWETGVHVPHRSTQKVLSMVAESAGFEYRTSRQPHQEQITPDPREDELA